MKPMKRVEPAKFKSVAVRMEEGLLARMDNYVKYLGRDRAYVISEAVKGALEIADAKDVEWIHSQCGSSSAKKVKGTGAV